MVCFSFLFFFSVFLTACGSGTSSTQTSLPITERDPATNPAAPDKRDFDSDPGSAQAVGFYSDGSLNGAEKFPDSGVGFLKLYLPRNRGWATRTLINVVKFAAAEVVSRNPNGGRLQVGDASKEAGGPASGHASHQNGLDVDLHYYHLDQREMDPNDVKGFDESFVQNGKLSPNFDHPRNWAMVRALVSTGMISRMFLDPVIKKALCAYRSEPGAREVLRRLRPYAGHDKHTHLRIRCPSSSRSCLDQTEVPSGDGCGSAAAISGNLASDAEFTGQGS
jgi:penicillin-insensitive murein endopeptidase